MNDSAVSFVPALTLLGLLVFLAVVLYWIRKRMFATGSGTGTNLRLISQMALGTQQRVVVVEVMSVQGPVQLILGVTPQQIHTLHVLPAPSNTSVATQDNADESSYRKIAQALTSSPQEARS